MMQNCTEKIVIWIAYKIRQDLNHGEPQMYTDNFKTILSVLICSSVVLF